MTLILIMLVVAAIVLKMINTKARFDERDRERERIRAAEEEAEIDAIRAEAVDAEFKSEETQADPDVD
ncbi:MAG: hypothetical protein IKE52_01430 [Mogibacterium sp.]|nr:hypothetical protein [Mogibacterium sp.]